METLSQTSDEKLYSLCKKYGEQTRFWRQKFTGLLPEVYKRRLYEKKGFSSIYEFAFKLAGLSEVQVSQALGLEKRLRDRGANILKQMFEEGEVSVNKLERVASAVNSKNQEFWANQVKLLSKKALETLIRDEKYIDREINHFVMHNGLEESSGLVMREILPGFGKDAKFLPGQELENNSREMLGPMQQIPEPNLSVEVKKKLYELEQKGIDINALFLELLEKREEEIAQEKERLARESEEVSLTTEGELKMRSRHIPTKIKNLIKQEFGDKCSVPYCHHSSETIHHTRRFALSQNHNPYFLAPLCEEHHAIAHSIDQKYVAKKSHP